MDEGKASQAILIVDDTPDIIEVLTRRLSSWGYRVLAAHSGEEGIQVARAQRPDLILLDHMMPKMKGRDALRYLKDDPQTKDIPVIFLTALELPDHVKAGMELGAEDYIVKPFDMSDLKERITVCLARHARPGS